MAVALLHGGVRILIERRVSLRRNHHARPSSRAVRFDRFVDPLPCRMHCPPPRTLEVLESVLAKRGLGLRREHVTPSVRTQQCCRSRDQRRCATCAMRAALAVCGRFQHESSSPCYRSLVGAERPLLYKGKEVGHVRAFSDLLLMFLLKAKRPVVYRDRGLPTRTELPDASASSSDAGLLTRISSATLEKALAEITDA